MAEEKKDEVDPATLAAAQKMAGLDQPDEPEKAGPVVRAYPDEEVDPSAEAVRAAEEERPDPPGRYADSPPPEEGPKHKK